MENETADINTRSLKTVFNFTLWSFIILVGPWILSFAVSKIDSDPTAGQAFGWLGLLTLITAGPVFIISLAMLIVRSLSAAGHQSPTPQEHISSAPLIATQQPKITRTITPLLDAILSKDIALVQTALFDRPEHLNTAYAQNGNTPLHVAALNGETELVKLLLAQPGIDKTLKNNEGKTARDLAQEKGFAEITDLLK